MAAKNKKDDDKTPPLGKGFAGDGEIEGQQTGADLGKGFGGAAVTEKQPAPATDKDKE